MDAEEIEETIVAVEKLQEQGAQVKLEVTLQSRLKPDISAGSRIFYPNHNERNS